MNIENENIKEYLEGKKLYGDDFNLNEIRKWFEDEKEAYANLGPKNKGNYQYHYHALNYNMGFRFLPDKKFPNVLGFGSAYGDELKPILKIIERIIIVESSEVLICKEINGFPVSYIKPNIDGSLPFSADVFDLITCFGVLHHVANVSKVVREFYRCLKPGGYALIREPTVSMGDWRKDRRPGGLTKRERGIPLNIFRQIISSTGFKIINEKRCMFPLTNRLRYLVKAPYNSKIALFIDNIFCRFFAWNNKYHPSHLFDKLRPTCVFYVLAKLST